MRTFLNFVRGLSGVQEFEERVARELPSAFALTAEPKRDWVLSCWRDDLESEGISSTAWPFINQPPPDPAAMPWTAALGIEGWNVLRDASRRAAIAESLESRLAFPNLDYNRGPPGFETPEKRVLLRIIFPRFPKPAAAELAHASTIIASFAKPCVIEFRAKPRLALRPGSRLKPPGTLGGLVRDGVGRVYAVTCGHVVAPLVGTGESDRRVRGERGEALGEIFRAVVPVRSPTGHICARPRTLPNQPPPAADPFANLLDVALIQLSGAPATTDLREIFSGFDGGTRIQMAGAESGTADYAVEDVNLWTKFPAEQGDDLHLCFQDLFRFQPLSENWLGRILQVLQGPRVANVVATAPKRGDSGAWITSSAIHGAPSWLGMLVGVSPGSGYALMSDVVWNWIRAELPGPVVVH